jgi:putative component of membrane protein insertase Oxa1/YidC/SpoIIIJ protein YidD
MEARFREAFKKTPFRSVAAFAAFSFYKMMIAPLLHSLGGVGMGCRYPQSCSEYAALSILEHGVVGGSCRALNRVCSCNPWTEPKPHLMVVQVKESIS